MEDKLIGFLITVIIALVIIAYVLSTILAAIQAVIDYLQELGSDFIIWLQSIWDWLLQLFGNIDLPPIPTPELPTPQSTPTAGSGQLVPGGQAIYIDESGKRLNCRSDHSTSSVIVTKIETGTIVDLIERHDALVDGYFWWKVKPPADPNCWVVENWLEPVELPPVTETPPVIETPPVVETPPVTSLASIEGKVTDGLDHNLVGVVVYLWTLNAGHIETTITDENGEYTFRELSTDPVYRVEVVLQDQNGRKQIWFGEEDGGQLIRVATPGWLLLEPNATERKDIDFADETLIANEQVKEHLPDLAAFYFHSQEIDNFILNGLKYRDYRSPTRIHAFLGQEADARTGSYKPAKETIFFGSALSSIENPLRPTGREWHENAHHIMNVVMHDSMNAVLVQYGEGDDNLVNHAGFPRNKNSGDAWLEGWATFWGCVMETKDNPATSKCEYPVKRNEDEYTTFQLETNWKVWDEYSGGFNPLCLLPGTACPATNMEEFAVAGLLWDLYDSKSALLDNDNIDWLNMGFRESAKKQLQKCPATITITH